MGTGMEYARQLGAACQLDEAEPMDYAEACRLRAEMRDAVRAAGADPSVVADPEPVPNRPDAWAIELNGVPVYGRRMWAVMARFMELGRDQEPRCHSTTEPAAGEPEKQESAPLHRACRTVLLMVGELHLRGYQRLRIAPGMSASGCYWRCAITPVSNIPAGHGARLVSENRLVAHYSSGQGREYFGWGDVAHLTPGKLAERFIDRCPEIVAEGKGSDWLYAGWYVEMLGKTYPDLFPIAYADWELPSDGLETTGARREVMLPMPPPGECDAPGP